MEDLQPPRLQPYAVSRIQPGCEVRSLSSLADSEATPERLQAFRFPAEWGKESLVSGTSSRGVESSRSSTGQATGRLVQGGASTSWSQEDDLLAGSCSPLSGGAPAGSSEVSAEDMVMRMPRLGRRSDQPPQRQDRPSLGDELAAARQELVQEQRQRALEQEGSQALESRVRYLLAEASAAASTEAGLERRLLAAEQRLSQEEGSLPRHADADSRLRDILVELGQERAEREKLQQSNSELRSQLQSASEDQAAHEALQRDHEGLRQQLFLMEEEAAEAGVASEGLAWEVQGLRAAGDRVTLLEQRLATAERSAEEATRRAPDGQKVLELEEEVGQLQSSRQTLEGQLSSFEEKMQLMEHRGEQLVEAQAESELLTAEITERLVVLRQNFRQQVHSNKLLKQEAAVSGELTSELSAARQAVTELREHAASESSNARELGQRAEQLQAEAGLRVAEQNKFHAQSMQLAQLQAEHAQLVAEWSAHGGSLQEALEDERRHVQELHRNVAELRAERQGSERNLAAAERACRSARAAAAAAEAREADLEDRLAADGRQLQWLESELAGREEDASARVAASLEGLGDERRRRERLQREVVELRAEASAATCRAASVAAAGAALEEDVESFEQELREARSAGAEAGWRASSAEGRLIVEGKRLDRLRTECALLTEDAEARVASMQEILAVEREAKEQLHSENAVLETECSEHRSRAAALRASREALEEKLGALDGRLAAAREAAQERVALLEDQIEGQASSLSRMAEECQELQRDRAAARGELEELRGVKADYRSLEAKLEAAEDAKDLEAARRALLQRLHEDVEQALNTTEEHAIQQARAVRSKLEEVQRGAVSEQRDGEERLADAEEVLQQERALRSRLEASCEEAVRQQRDTQERVSSMEAAVFAAQAELASLLGSREASLADKDEVEDRGKGASTRPCDLEGHTTDATEPAVEPSPATRDGVLLCFSPSSQGRIARPAEGGGRLQARCSSVQDALEDIMTRATRASQTLARQEEALRGGQLQSGRSEERFALPHEAEGEGKWQRCASSASLPTPRRRVQPSRRRRRRSLSLEEHEVQKWRESAEAAFRYRTSQLREEWHIERCALQNEIRTLLETQAAQAKALSLIRDAEEAQRSMQQQNEDNSRASASRPAQAESRSTFSEFSVLRSSKAQYHGCQEPQLPGGLKASSSGGSSGSRSVPLRSPFGSTGARLPHRNGSSGSTGSRLPHRSPGKGGLQVPQPQVVVIRPPMTALAPEQQQQQPCSQSLAELQADWNVKHQQLQEELWEAGGGSARWAVPSASSSAPSASSQPSAASSPSKGQRGKGSPTGSRTGSNGALSHLRLSLGAGHGDSSGLRNSSACRLPLRGIAAAPGSLVRRPSQRSARDARDYRHREPSPSGVLSRRSPRSPVSPLSPTSPGRSSRLGASSSQTRRPDEEAAGGCSRLRGSLQSALALSRGELTGDETAEEPEGEQPSWSEKLLEPEPPPWWCGPGLRRPRSAGQVRTGWR